MNTCGHLQILCALFLAFHGVVCYEIDKRKYYNGRDEFSSADFFKFVWGNSRHRRSVKSVGDERTPQTKPQFECGDKVLAVLLNHADAINTRIYGPRGKLLQLGQLAAFCGVSVKPTQRDVRLVFNYDSCYVKKEETVHVLYLNWYGTDLVLPCPIYEAPSVICKNGGMELTIAGDGKAEELSVALNQEWAPLLYVATQCWHRERSNHGKFIFFIPHLSCGVHFKDGRYFLDLRSKDKLMTLSCPYYPRFPVKDLGLSATSQLLPQNNPSVYYKPPIGFPSKAAAASQVGKQEQAFAVKQQERDAAKTSPLHPRAHWLPKLPPLPGTFNLSVNFPFSVPLPKHPEPMRYHGWLYTTPAPTTAETTTEPTPAPSPTPDDLSSAQELAPIVELENYQLPYEPMERERVAPFMFPHSQYHHHHHHHMRHPDRFQPALTYSQTGSSPTLQNQPSGTVNSALASLAQYLPPGYFICSYKNQEPSLPQAFKPPVPSSSQSLQNPNYQSPESPEFVPAEPPMKEYSEQQLARPASSPYDSSSRLYQQTQYLQPTQYQPFFYQSGHGRRGSSTTSLTPPRLVPINLLSQSRPYSAYPAVQDARPFQSQYYQKPSQSGGSVQQTVSSSLPVNVLAQDSRPSSSQASEYLYQRTGGDQYVGSVVQSSSTGISSDPQYLASQLFKFQNPPLKPEVLSADVYMDNTGSRFFMPRSSAPVHGPKDQSSTGNRPFISLPTKEGAQIPHSQGPSVHYRHNQQPEDSE